MEIGSRRHPELTLETFMKKAYETGRDFAQRIEALKNTGIE